MENQCRYYRIQPGIRQAECCGALVYNVTPGGVCGFCGFQIVTSRKPSRKSDRRRRVQALLGLVDAVETLLMGAGSLGSVERALDNWYASRKPQHQTSIQLHKHG